MRLPAQNIRLSQHRRSWQYNIISHCDFRALVWISHLCIASTGQKSSLSWWKIWLWRNAPPATLVMPTDCLCLSPWHGKHWSTVDHQLPECVNFTFWQSKHSHTLPSIYQNYFDIWNWIRNDVAPRSLHLTTFWAHKGSCLNYFNIQITCTTCLEPYHPTFRARKQCLNSIIRHPSQIHKLRMQWIGWQEQVRHFIPAFKCRLDTHRHNERLQLQEQCHNAKLLCELITAPSHVQQWLKTTHIFPCRYNQQLSSSKYWLFCNLFQAPPQWPCQSPQSPRWAACACPRSCQCWLRTPPHGDFTCS